MKYIEKEWRQFHESEIGKAADSRTAFYAGAVSMIQLLQERLIRVGVTDEERDAFAKQIDEEQAEFLRELGAGPRSVH